MDKETAPFQSAEPRPDEEWEYETEPRGRILWGRIAALAIALLLAFLLGRITAGGGTGVSQARYAKVQRDLAAARAEIAGQSASPATTESPAASPNPSLSTTPGGATGRTYVVKSGDTLRAIALKFYGDASLADLIAQANHITDPTLVHQGIKLIIPPQP